MQQIFKIDCHHCLDLFVPPIRFLKFPKGFFPYSRISLDRPSEPINICPIILPNQELIEYLVVKHYQIVIFFLLLLLLLRHLPFTHPSLLLLI